MGKDLNILKPLRNRDLKRLDDFLLSDAADDECLMLDEMHGFLTAVVCSPGMIMPSEWLPAVWGGAGV